eukprot:GHUV01039049.1.p1 GENE.GHUV01039049.1~~GHUV01039049.1.p1  ORF type:complete len:465 (+),score=115.48 GHUV01039049.1:190-1584(+)
MLGLAGRVGAQAVGYSRFRAMVSASCIVPPRPRARGLVVRNETMEQRLTRAKGYPYARPSTSFIFCNGHAYTFPNSSWVPPSHWNGSLQALQQLQVTAADGSTCRLQTVLEREGVEDSALLSADGKPLPLTPILAIGSNAGPEQLGRKFPIDLFPAGVVVPVGKSKKSMSERCRASRWGGGVCRYRAACLTGSIVTGSSTLRLSCNVKLSCCEQLMAFHRWCWGTMMMLRSDCLHALQVIQCVLQDFDVVYAPLISSYGSATATLEHSPGTSVAVFITYLTPLLQQRMHETEGAYNLCKLTDVQLLEGVSLQHHTDGEQPVQVQSTVYQYNHQHGTLHMPFTNPGRSPVALAEIQAHGRQFPALSQVQMQAALKAALRQVTEDELPGHGGAAHQLLAASITHHTEGGMQQQHSEDLDGWIMTNLTQHSLRRARVQALTKAAEPFKYSSCEVMMVIGTALSTSVK